MLRFRPKLFDTLSGYNRETCINDISAGITVGVLALPLAMAFAIASGLSPAAGIWTAIVAGFIISALGGSRVQIGGPTGAFIPIVYAVVADYGIQNLLIATMMSGVMLFSMGALRLGNMIRFIPVSVVIGFTNGIAIVIFVSQIKDFLGLQTGDLPGEFFAKMQALGSALNTISLPSTAVAVISLALLLLWNRAARRIAWMRRLPGPLATLLIMTAVTTLIQMFDIEGHFAVDTIGSRFGGIPQGLPTIALPAFSLTTLGKLVAPALTIALLGAIESLLSARVADNQIDGRHDPNQELMAQGIANVAAPLFGGFAATGAIARTATNIRAGGRTPVAGILHAFVLLLIVLVLAPLASHIPLATLSAIVVVVAVNMGDWHAFSWHKIKRNSRLDQTVLLATFLITVFFDLTLAVQIGMLMASLFFIFRMSDLTRIEPIRLTNHFAPEVLTRSDGSPSILAYRLSGNLFFGAANKLESLLLMHQDNPDIVILDMDKVISIDTTGLDILQNLHRKLQAYGATLILCSLNLQPASVISRSGFQEILGDDNIATTMTEVLVRAQQLRGADINRIEE